MAGAQSRQLRIIAAAIVLIGSLSYLASTFMRGSTSRRLSDQVYFLDLGAHELFAMDRGVLSPIDAPSGANQQAVRAYVYGCGGCAEQTIVHLRKYTQAAMQQMNLPAPEQDVDELDRGTLVAGYARGAEPQWHAVSTPEGMAILAKPGSLCADAVECHP